MSSKPLFSLSKTGRRPPWGRTKYAHGCAPGRPETLCFMGFAEQCAENAHKKCQLLRGCYRTKPLYFVYIHANRRDPKRTPRTPLADAGLHVGGPENTHTKRAQNPKIPTI